MQISLSDFLTPQHIQIDEVDKCRSKDLCLAQGYESLCGRQKWQTRETVSVTSARQGPRQCSLDLCSVCLPSNRFNSYETRGYA